MSTQAHVFLSLWKQFSSRSFGNPGTSKLSGPWVSLDKDYKTNTPLLQSSSCIHRLCSNLDWHNFHDSANEITRTKAKTTRNFLPCFARSSHESSFAGSFKYRNRRHACRRTHKNHWRTKAKANGQRRTKAFSWTTDTSLELDGRISTHKHIHTRTLVCPRTSVNRLKNHSRRDRGISIFRSCSLCSSWKGVSKASVSNSKHDPNWIPTKLWASPVFECTGENNSRQRPSLNETNTFPARRSKLETLTQQSLQTFSLLTKILPVSWGRNDWERLWPASIDKAWVRLHPLLARIQNLPLHEEPNE